MKYINLEADLHGKVRNHPWVDAAADPRAKYYDFRESPEFIRTNLEDLQPYKETLVAERFFRLVEWLNSDECALESNDTCFSGPQPTPAAPGLGFVLECGGRVMVFFRDLVANLDQQRVMDLGESLAPILARYDPDFTAGAIHLSLARTRFSELPTVGGQAPIGLQLVIYFYAFGHESDDCLKNGARVVGNVHEALRQVNRLVPRASVADKSTSG